MCARQKRGSLPFRSVRHAISPRLDGASRLLKNNFGGP